MDIFLTLLTIVCIYHKQRSNKERNCRGCDPAPGDVQALAGIDPSIHPTPHWVSTVILQGQWLGT